MTGTCCHICRNTAHSSACQNPAAAVTMCDQNLQRGVGTIVVLQYVVVSGRFVCGVLAWQWSGAGVVNVGPGHVAGHGSCEALPCWGRDGACGVVPELVGVTPGLVSVALGISHEWWVLHVVTWLWGLSRGEVLVVEVVDGGDGVRSDIRVSSKQRGFRAGVTEANKPRGRDPRASEGGTRESETRWCERMRSMVNTLARLGSGSVDEGVGECWGWRGGGRDYSEGESKVSGLEDEGGDGNGDG
ncbi:hypothetical protein EDB83DRAFT_2310692 [Lactarius deliciosus]|nr:hypothetical protein EDB83DRAFT_2310692 [Lactarius deliciosus]